MKNFSLLFAAALLFSLSSAAEQKIGYVNMELALSRQLEAQKHTRYFEEEENKILKAEGEARTSIEKELASFNDSKSKLADAARLKKETELGEKINKLQTQFAQRRMELNQKRQEILQQLQTKNQLQIESISRKGGFSMVINSAALLYVSDDVKKNDLTDKLVAAYNEAYPVTDGAKKAPAKPAPKNNNNNAKVSAK